MQLIISILFSLFLSLTPNLDFHKFYVSTTDIVYKSEKKSIQITTQLFIDDIERLLQQDNPGVRLDPDSDSKYINTILEAVLNKVFRIQMDQEFINFEFIGREYKYDILQCYMEIEVLSPPETISIKNTIFFNLFEDQQNIIHFKNGNIRKSFLLHHENNMVRFSLD